MSISLEADERAELLRILVARRRELSSEIHHTATPSYKRELRSEAEVLDRLIAGSDVEPDAGLVDDVLASYAAELRYGTRRTEHPSYRHELQDEADVLHRLVDKFTAR